MRRSSSLLSLGTKEDAIFASLLCRAASPTPFSAREIISSVCSNNYTSARTYTARVQMNFSFAAYVTITSSMFTHNIRWSVSSERSDWSNLAARVIKHVLRIPLWDLGFFPVQTIRPVIFVSVGTFYFSPSAAFSLAAEQAQRQKARLSLWGGRDLWIRKEVQRRFSTRRAPLALAIATSWSCLYTQSSITERSKLVREREKLSLAELDEPGVRCGSTACPVFFWSS